MTASAEQLRRSAAFWGRLPETSEQRAARIAATRERLYQNSPSYEGLQSYTSNRPPSKYAQRLGESDAGYVRRLQPLLHHLAQSLGEAELAATAESYNAAVTRLEGGTQTHEQLREQLDARVSGTGVGLLPEASQRAELVGGHGFGGEQQLERQGGVYDGRLDLRAAYEAKNLPVFAQRQRPPAGSSGEGWTVSRG
jgi:hypothetical protein